MGVSLRAGDGALAGPFFIQACARSGATPLGASFPIPLLKGTDALVSRLQRHRLPQVFEFILLSKCSNAIDPNGGNVSVVRQVTLMAVGKCSHNR
jgi:hypothetical protein